jgi:hypothetical protein
MKNTRNNLFPNPEQKNKQVLISFYMKKSNKLLLSAVLLPLVLLGIVHLNLYARYKAGNFISAKQLHAEQFERKELPSPVYLSVNGIGNITIVPSDTFAVEFDKVYINEREKFLQKGLQGPDLHYYRKGDTLAITGQDTVSQDNQASIRAIQPFPGITLYCRRIKTMEFNDAHIFIKQAKGSILTNPSLILKNSFCLLGDFEEDPDTSCCTYDSLRVQEIKSTLNLNQYVAIRELSVELDSFSILNDGSAKIGNPVIRFNDQSTLNLKGANIRKLSLK